MFSNFLIGLREGLEASLIVGILVAYIVKTGRTERLWAIWAGVIAAVVATIGFVSILELTSNSLSERSEIIFTGIMSLLTTGFLTWMILWMRKTSHKIKGELHGKLDSVVDMGSFALVLLAFVAVGREGVETGLFLWTNDQATGAASHPALGGVLGLLTSVVLGYLIYQRAVHFNMSTFFKITGALLILVAAGVLAYGVHEFQELGWLPGDENKALNISSWFDGESWYGSVAKGLFNFTPVLSVLQVVVWFGYLVPTMYLFFKPVARTNAVPATNPEPRDASVLRKSQSKNTLENTL